MMRAMYASAIALTAAMGWTGAQAQEAVRQAEAETTGRDVIIVTAQKREQAITDVPVAITAYTGSRLRDLGIEQFDDLALFVPGLEIQEQSPNNPGFVIRGITSDDGGANQEARVSVFQDGVSISRSRGAYVELHDMERIEVVKGPQTTLFGRGALIGAVSLIQRKADVNAGVTGDAAIGASNFNGFNARAASNIPLIDGVLAARVSAIYKTRDGYVGNLAGGEDFMSQNVAAFRTSFRFQPIESWTLDLIYNWQQDTPSGTSFKSRAYAPPGGDTRPTTAAGLSTFSDPVGGRFLDGRALGVDRTVQSATLLSDLEINDAWSFNTIIGWRTFDSVEVFDPDGFIQPVLLFAEDAQGDQFSIEARVNYDDGGALSAFAGVSYFREKGSQLVPLQYDERGTLALFAALTQGRPVTALFSPAVFPNFPTNAQAGAILRPTGNPPFKPTHQEEFQNWGQTDAFDVFADATLRITPKLEVSGGLRWTQDGKTSWYRGRVVNGVSTITGGGLFANLTPNGAKLRGDETYDDVTWRAAVRYQLTDSWNAYLNAGKGRRPEVLNYVPATRSFVTIPAEIATSYEAGVKGSAFDGRLAVEASVYTYEYENFQTSVREGVRIVPINAGNASSTGFEFTGQLEAIPDVLTLLATYGFGESRFDDTDDQGRRQVFAGNSFRLSPDHTVSLAALWTIDSPWGRFDITPTYTWQSEVFFDNSNQADLVEDSYGLLNLRVKYSRGASPWTLEAYATNLADEDYIIDAGNTGNVFGIPTFIAGPPRMYGVQLSVAF